MRQRKILIVEDELIIAMMIEQMLVRQGHQVVGKVTTGESAVEAAGEHNPDLILMDIRLEGEMDGIDAIKAIRRKQNIPVIFLTGNSDEGYRKRINETEYLAFLTKPVTHNDLTEWIARAS